MPAAPRVAAARPALLPRRATALRARAAAWGVAAALLAAAAPCAQAAGLALAVDPPAPQAGQPLRLSARFVGDGGFALGGMQPRGWLLPREGRPACAVPPVAAGARPVEGRLLITEQDDHTLAAVDLQRNLASSNIAWLARLPEAPAAWVLDAAGAQAVVALPAAGELRWLSLATGGELARLDRGLGEPSRLLLAPEAGGLWAFDRQGSRLLWIESGPGVPEGAGPQAVSPAAAQATARAAPASARPAVPRVLGLDAAPDALLWLPGPRLLAVATGRTLRLVAPGAQAVRELRLPAPARTLAVSALAGALYVARAGEPRVDAIDLDSGVLRASAPLLRTASRLLASPDGRWLFGIADDEGVVSVIDTATHRPRHALQIHAGIADARLSAGMLYLRERRRAFTSLLRLDSLGGREPRVIAVPAGTAEAAPGRLAPLGGDGMAMLNADEGVAYLYMESGMADGHGPMRSPTEMVNPYEAVRLRAGRVVAMEVHERGFGEARPGHFEATARVADGGAWRLVVREARNDLLACLDFDVAGPPRAQAAPAAVGWRLVAAQARPRVDGDGPPAVWPLRLVDAHGEALAAGPDRLALLLYAPGRNWQRRVELARSADGQYRLPRAGLAGLDGERLNLLPLGRRFDGARPLTLEWAP